MSAQKIIILIPIWLNQRYESIPVPSLIPTPKIINPTESAKEIAIILGKIHFYNQIPYSNKLGMT